jgi:cysteine desulfurase
MPDPIYLDHAATTPVRPEVREAMEPFYGPRFGNPSSTHRWGREARAALDEARDRIAKCLGANSDEIAFTSGGTEGDNLAILGAFRALKPKGKRVAVTTGIEHKAVLAAVHQVAAEGGEERIVAVDANGVVDRKSYDAALRDDVAIVSVMWVNNEIGTIQSIPELAAAAKARGALFHTDGVQAFGKVKIDAKSQPFDYLTFSGHKIGAPKGIGAQFIRRGSPLEPLQHGGQQNRGQRPGTENVAAAVGLARAAELTLAEMDEELARLTAMRDTLQAALLANIPDAVVHAQHAPRAAHILSISVPGTDSESLLMAMDLAGVACSSGSACQSGNVDPSHVLCAIGSPRDVAVAAIRMSLGSLTTPEQIDRVAQIFPKLVAKARRLATAAS